MKIPLNCVVLDSSRERERAVFLLSQSCSSTKRIASLAGEFSTLSWTVRGFILAMRLHLFSVMPIWLRI
ncbi:hypothetical protein BpHYR1_054459 [Brachionus plicatilis]|uniref:Uncharacterized protein n=1 Tax=Brachionus plicatilis TaxID=10195 RepID=A0A3M7QHU1_BRAPC|nr:hypothetical protein BpHYR1_054459 [Brachionus plicatilis]